MKKIEEDCEDQLKLILNGESGTFEVQGMMSFTKEALFFLALFALLDKDQEALIGHITRLAIEQEPEKFNDLIDGLNQLLDHPSATTSLH